MVMLNGVIRREASSESLRSPLLRTLREASYRVTIHTPNQQRQKIGFEILLPAFGAGFGMRANATLR